MCGIFGSPDLTPSVHLMFPHLALAMETRGRHSWGASNGEDVIRHLGPIHKTWAQEAVHGPIPQWHEAIVHTRAASVGPSDKFENAHPFTFMKEDGTSVIGIHNGTLSNHVELNTKNSRNFEVDSMHLWAHRAAGLPWTDMSGWGNLAWYETVDGERRLYLCRINNTALHVSMLGDGGIVFASEQAAIDLAADMAGVKVASNYTVEEGVLYHLRKDALYRTEGRLRFAPTYVPPTTPCYTHVRPGGYGGRRGGGSAGFYPGCGSGYSGLDAGDDIYYCSKCTHTIAKAEHLLCVTCMSKLMKDFEAFEELDGDMTPTQFLHGKALVAAVSKIQLAVSLSEQLVDVIY